MGTTERKSSTTGIMKNFLLFAFFYLANSAEVEKRWGWTTPHYRPSYEPTRAPATEEPCLIAEQAKILEGLVRVNLLFVKTTTERSLQRFLVNKLPSWKIPSIRLYVSLNLFLSQAQT